MNFSPLVIGENDRSVSAWAGIAESGAVGKYDRSPCLKMGLDGGL
jgi:hypothetical protein